MPAFVSCCSHSPMMTMGLEPTVQGEQERYHEAMAEVAADLAEYDPEIVVAFYPDHFIGFPLDLMPSFCVGLEARSAVEFGIVDERLDVPRELGAGLLRHLHGRDLDAAFSHKMLVDHGCTLTLTQLLGNITSRPVLPIFVNCGGDPRPTFRRVRQLGQAVGEYLATTGLRVAVIGSGGLSHDSPSSRIAKETPEKFLRENRRNAEEQRAFELAGADNARRVVRGDSSASRMPNPDWDHEFLRALLSFDVDVLDSIEDEKLDREAGGGTHEVRTWVAAVAAARTLGTTDVEQVYYATITEWISGMGVIAGGRVSRTMSMVGGGSDA